MQWTNDYRLYMSGTIGTNISDGLQYIVCNFVCVFVYNHGYVCGMYGKNRSSRPWMSCTRRAAPSTRFPRPSFHMFWLVYQGLSPLKSPHTLSVHFATAVTPALNIDINMTALPLSLFEILQTLDILRYDITRYCTEHNNFEGKILETH